MNKIHYHPYTVGVNILIIVYLLHVYRKRINSLGERIQTLRYITRSRSITSITVHSSLRYPFYRTRLIRKRCGKINCPYQTATRCTDSFRWGGLANVGNMFQSASHFRLCVKRKAIFSQLTCTYTHTRDPSLTEPRRGISGRQ